MDEKTREKIHALAKSFKELHLSASMEEALERAKDIVLSTEDNSKPVKDLLSDVKEEVVSEEHEAKSAEHFTETARKEFDSEVSEETKDTDKALDFSESSRAYVNKMFSELKSDIKEHKEEKPFIEESSEEIDKIHHASDDVEFFIDEADRIQKKKKH